MEFTLTKAGKKQATASARARPHIKLPLKKKTSRHRRGEAQKRIPDILAAAFAEFTEKGYGGASMDNVAARLNVTKPIIYRHFKNKQALFEALLERNLTSELVPVAKQVRSYRGPVKQLLRLIVARVNPDSIRTAFALPLFRLVLSDGYRSPLFAQTFYQEYLRPIAEMVEVVFDHAMADGRMRKADPHFAAREFFAPWWHQLMITILMGREYADTWRTREYLDHALEAFCRSYEIPD